jgi:hypothetical protein
VDDTSVPTSRTTGIVLLGWIPAQRVIRTLPLAKVILGNTVLPLKSRFLEILGLQFQGLIPHPWLLCSRYPRLCPTQQVSPLFHSRPQCWENIPIISIVFYCQYFWAAEKLRICLDGISLYRSINNWHHFLAWAIGGKREETVKWSCNNRKKRTYS